MLKFFHPDSVVLIGAPRKAGPGSYNGIELMLRYGFKGRIYPVNPNISPTTEEIFGLKAYSSVTEIPERADLALISVSRDQVLGALDSCIRAGIRNIIIISQGFSDADLRGRELQAAIEKLAQESKVRVLGPNTMGIINNFIQFSTGFIDLTPPRFVPPVALIAQTGLIQVASQNFAYQAWGKAVDLGNACDLDVVDALDYFASDPETEIIVLHIEGMRRGREFLERAALITPKKPIIALKTGHSAAGARAALSHTGSLVGEDAVYDAVFERAGILRVKNNFEMSIAIRSLLRFNELQGTSLGIITATGAAGIMASDACEEAGFSVANLSKGIAEKLRRGMADWVRVGNPLDIWPLGMIGRKYREVYRLALKEFLDSPEIDAVLNIVPDFRSPLHPDTEILDVVREVQENCDGGKPVAMWLYMSNAETEEAFEEIKGVACYPSIEGAVKGLSYCKKYHGIRHRKSPVQKVFPLDADPAEVLLQKGRGEKALLGRDALRLLAAFGIPTANGIDAHCWNEIEMGVEILQFPLVLKVAGKKFLHKSEWGGVITDIRNHDDLKCAYEKILANIGKRLPEEVYISEFQVQEEAKGKEILIGLKNDDSFGPVIACGLGGIYTEVFKDIRRELVPISSREAEKMLTSLKIYPLLSGVRGEAGVDWSGLVEILERVSFMATRAPDIRELDINPVMADKSGCRAVDARILW